MKYYSGSWELYNNGEFIDGGFLGNCLTDEKMEKETFNITWENLNEIYQKTGIFKCGFNYWNFKKGRRISFFNGHPFNKNKKDIKEWKIQKLNLILIYKWTEIKNPSMENLLKMDAIKVQKFLKERE